MKITKLSLVAIATMALTTDAMADVDMNIGGQAVVYYQTADAGANDMFNRDNSNANFGLQLNANANLGNDFGLGLQGTALNALGLNNNLVGNARVMQGAGAGGDVNAGAGSDSKNYFSITKAYLTKKVGNTTVKMGRQELPKSLSPLAFSEGWNVFKNTFDAVVAINSDIPDTTVVGAYVSGANPSAGGQDFTTFSDLKTAGGATINSGAYMLTVANKSSKMVQPTLTYYALKDLNTVGGKSGNALWADVQVDANLPATLALQAGQIDPSNNLSKTKVVGAKVTGKASNVNLSLAYTKVGSGAVSVQNVGTGVKTPLYTQMVANQNAISKDADTVVLKGVMPLAAGKLIAQYGMTTDNSAAKNDYNELDVIYKFKAFGTNMLAAYVMQKADNKIFAKNAAGVGTDDTKNIIRVWTRYNF